MILKPLSAAAICALAAYGLAWFVLAERILAMQCDARLWIVERDALAAEELHEWMIAAHGYAFLISYGPDDEWGCQSEKVNDGAWLLPLWYPFLRANSTDRPRNPDRWISLYESNLRRALGAQGGPIDVDLAARRRGSD
jgi:hypothetical protein